MAPSAEFTTVQSTPCPHCGQQHPAGTAICPVTGMAMRQGHMTCPNCGSVIETDWVRCPQCAAELSAPPPPPPVPHPVSPPAVKRRGWLWLALPLGIIFLAGIIIGGYFLLSYLGDGRLLAWAGIDQTPTPSTTPLPTSTGLPTPFQPSETPALAPETGTPTPTLEIPSTSTGTPTPPPIATFTATPSPTPAEGPWEACANTYLSRLRVGDLAFVAFDPPLANRVRERPNTDATILGRIEPGEEIEILGGPACNTRWVWWEIRSLKTDLQGWTSEGDGEDYWLVPLEN